MDNILNSKQRYVFIFLGLLGSLAAAGLAVSHHAPISEYSKSILMNASILELLEILLGFTILSNFQKFGRFAPITISLIMLGSVLFFLPVAFKALGIIDKTPSAPFGGFLFIISWSVIAIGYFIKNKQND